MHRFKVAIRQTICGAAAVFLILAGSYGLSYASGCNTGNLDPAECQWLLDAAQTTPQTSLTPNAAPPSSMNNTNPACIGVCIGTVCGTQQCSDGAKQQATVTNILYNNNFDPAGSSTTCRFVDNNTSDDIFVPQNSAVEFQSFIAHAPANIEFGYCVDPLNKSLPITPTYGGCTVPASGPVTCAITDPTYVDPEEIIAAPPASTSINLNIGVVRVTSPPITIPSQTASFSYLRQDCRNTAAGAQICQPHAITESQVASAATVANPNAACTNPQANLNTNCNGSWQVSSTTKCYVDGSTTPVACPPAFNPPPLQSCTAGSPPSSITSGRSATLPVTSTQPPTSSECPYGLGTRVDDISTPTTYSCFDGLVTVTGTGTSTETGYTGACDPAPPLPPPPSSSSSSGSGSSTSSSSGSTSSSGSGSGSTSSGGTSSGGSSSGSTGSSSTSSGSTSSSGTSSGSTSSSGSSSGIVSSSTSSSSGGSTSSSSSSGGGCTTSQNIYVVDQSNGRVEVFDTRGNYISQFGSPGSGNGQFDHPWAIRMLQNGNFIITDSNNARAQIFTSGGAYVTQITGFATPDMAAQSPNGDIWITDYNNSTMTRYNSSYVAQNTVSGFNLPTGISFDSANNIYVSNAGTDEIIKLNSSGTMLSRFGSAGTANGQFQFPWAHAFDSTGKFWVVDSSNDRIQIFDSSNNFLFKIGTSGSGDGQLSLPLDLAFDSCGDAWLTDQNNNRVVKFDSMGNFLFKFGTSGSGNGQFLAPTGIVVK